MTEATLTRATPLRHSPPLDGLRGVFVLLILLVHSAYFNFESLAVTVDGFFVTSGFLITTLLLEEHRRTAAPAHSTPSPSMFAAPFGCSPRCTPSS